MMYQLTMVEVSVINSETQETKDIREFDNIEAAKGFVEQIVIALKVNVEKKCAIRCDVTKNWEVASDNTLTKSIYYEESKKVHKNILWMIKEISSFISVKIG